MSSCGTRLHALALSEPNITSDKFILKFAKTDTLHFRWLPVCRW